MEVLDLSSHELFGLAQVVAYFGILIYAFVVVIVRLPIWSFKGTVYGHWIWAVVFLLLQAVVDLAVTWFLIFRFVYEDTMTFESWEEWMDKGDLFFKAYVLVTEDPRRWFWSSQLLCWVLVGVMFMTLEGRRLNIRHIWAYVVIGFLGAISVAFPLFFTHIIVEQKNKMSEARGKTNQSVRKETFSLSLTMSFCVLLAFVASNLMPYYLELNDVSMFKWCLVIVHCILLLPAILQIFQRPTDGGVHVHASEGFLVFILCVAALCCGAHMYNAAEAYKHVIGHNSTLEVLNEESVTIFTKSLLAEILNNDCQMSITADMLFTSIATLIFTLAESRRFDSFILVLVGGLLFSPVVSTALFLVYRELYLVPVMYDNRVEEASKRKKHQ